jgi:predicted DNA-binding transcriptional regulator YafY
MLSGFHRIWPDEEIMSYSTARVLALLELLETHGRVRGEELARRLEVNERTVRRYVMTLRYRGVPIEMERGRYGGYYLSAGYKRPLALTEREALSTAWGLLRSARQDVGVVGSDSMRALDKLSMALPQSTRDMVRSLEQVVTFADSPAHADDPVDVEHLKAILYAVASHRQVRMSYHSWSGDVTERLVDPYHVVCRYGRWYLVGYCHLRTDQRVFRLDHVLDVTLLADTFRPPAIDALAAVERSIGQVPWRWEYRVQLDLPLEVAAQRISPATARLEQSHRGVIMCGYADDLAWIAHLLVGLRCPLVVLSPPELREELHALAEHARRIATEASFADAPIAIADADDHCRN